MNGRSGHGASGSAPTVSAISSSSGCPADGVVITGTNLSTATSVSLNGTAASFYATSTQVYALTPNGGTTGTWSVTTPSGSASSSTYTVGSCPFNFDLTGSTLPATITAARTGSDVYAQSGSGTVALWTAAQNGVYECGGNKDCGWWAFGPRTNLSPDSVFTSFASASWTKTNVTVAANAATDPFGSTTATYAKQTAGATAQIVASGLGAASTCKGLAAVWVRDGSPIETAAGAISARGDGGEAVTLGTGATWRRAGTLFSRDVIGSSTAAFSIWPAGAAASTYWVYPGGLPTFDTAQSGGDYFWGTQAETICDSGLVPVVNGTSSAATLQVAGGSLASALNAGDMHISASFLADPLFINASGALYALSTTSASGLTGVSVDAGSTWTTSINGGATSASVNPGATVPSQSLPMDVTIELWDMPSTSAAGSSVWLQGFRQYTFTTTLTSQTMATPTNFYLGSNAGSSAYLARKFSRLRRVTNDVNAAEGVMLGDSLSATYSGAASVGPWIYNLWQARTRPGIVGYQTPGETSTNQKTRWDGSPQKGQSYVKWVSILVGVNDIGGGGLTEAVTSANIQSLINDIHAANPTAKILLMPIPPVGCYATFTPTQVTYVKNLNLDIAGTGPTPITDPGSVLIRMPAWSAMDNGSFCYLPQYDLGDHLHENDAGRQIIGQAIGATLAANGLL